MAERARESWSPVARWGWRIAILGGLVTFYGVVLHRYGQIETPAAFALLCAGVAIAGLALCLGVYAMVQTWMRVVRGFRYALGASVLAMAVIAGPAYHVVPALSLPAVAGVSTDLADPPRFTAAPLLRPAWANDLTARPASEAEAAAQRAAYPEIVPLVLQMQPEEGFDVARRAIASLGWDLTASLEPPLPDAEGQIEAVVRTEILAFADDIVVRVRPDAGQTRFDARSVSRFGRSDLGANARHVRALFATIRGIAEQ